MKLLSSFFVMAFVMLLAVSPAKADEAFEAKAKAHVQTLGDKAIAVISNTSNTKADREREFNKLLVQYFDLKSIGRFVLGRYWRDATPEQHKEYLKLFQKMIASMYAEKFSTYTNEKFNVVNAVAKNERDAIVSSQIEFDGSRPPIMLEWRVRNKEDGLKIVDLSVEGISMSVTQRSDYNSVIQKNDGDVEALLVTLRDNYNK